MAHTPLFRALQRWLRLARAAEQQPCPTQEYLEQRQSLQHLTRRQALQTAAMLFATLPVMHCTARRRDDRVAVVGAGLAGLHAAYRLRQAGVLADVYEASTRLGGRVLTARGLHEGQVAELGGEFVNSDHFYMHSLAREFGLPMDDLFASGPAGQRRETFYFQGRLVEEADIVAAFRPVATRMAAAVEAAARDDAIFQQLDALSIAEWLDGVAEASALLKAILDVAYIGEYGLEVAEQSVFNLLLLIDFETPAPFRLIGDSDERWRLRAGSDVLSTRLAEPIAGQIHTDMRLVALSQRPDGVYRLTFEQGRAVVEREARHVLLALPFSTLRQVAMRLPLSAEKRHMIAELSYGTNAKLLGHYSARVWSTVHQSSGTAYTDNGLQVLWEATRGQSGTGGMLTVLLGGARGLAVGSDTPEAQFVRLLPQVEAIFPGTAARYWPGSALRMHWPSVPFALGSYVAYRPGQTIWRGLEGEREGNLHFCGEHTSVDYQGFMEGACETGAWAAQEILYDLNVSTDHIPSVVGSRLSFRQAPLRGHTARPYRRIAHRRLLRRFGT